MSGDGTMNRSRPEVLDLHPKPASSASRSRSRSSGSLDNPLSSNASTTSLGISPLINASPAPAYIAASAAGRLVTGDHESFFRSLNDGGIVGLSTPTMFVSCGSLALVNQFLDFLLYSFLSNAKSTSISALRPAITEVLRIRLAKEAVAGADQELRSYLGGDDEDIDSFDDVLIESDGEDWNLESTWRKCRVQCMVYSSLGDLEEGDEAFYSDNILEGYVGPERYQQQSSSLGVVSPPVAIWLTSILEFIGEQTLLVAGHATIARYSAQRIAAASSPTSDASSEVTFPDKPMVEELDTEKVALNPSLGRMWRQWRKKVRSARGGSFSIPSRDSVLQRFERQASLKRATSAEEGRPSSDNSEAVHKEDCTTTAPESDSRSAGLPGSVLPPIVESAAPGLFDASKRLLLQRDREDHNVLRRPQSLMILPWTHSPPFILSTAIRRPLSLPDLKRGDFADPKAEGDDIPHEVGPVVEQPYMKIPLPRLGREESLEPAGAPAHRENCEATALPNEPRVPIGRDSVKVTRSVAPISLHLQMPEDSQSTPIENKDQDALATRVSESSYRSCRVQPEEYDPYAVKASLPGTPTGPQTFFSDEDDSPPRRRGRSDEFVPRAPTERTTSSHLKHTSSSSSGNSLSDRKIGQLHLVQSSGSIHSIASERGTGVRVFTPPATPDKSRRSSSFSKIQRPIHTSSSASSQASILKTFIPWPHDSGKHTKVHESDGESRSSHNSERLASLDDKERSFEELISSGGTIHCTITPDPIRNMEKTHDSPSQKTPTSDLADFFRSTGPDGRPLPIASKVPGSPRGPIHKSPPVQVRNSRNDGASSSLSSFLKNSAQPGSPGLSSSHGTSNKLQRMMSDSMPIVSITPASGPSSSGLPAVIRRENPIMHSYPRNRLLAREASGSTGSDTTSALADFFRNTNPPANGAQVGHRIPRSVAPFRTTMDSAQFDTTVETNIIEEAEPEHSTKTPSVNSAPHESYSSSFTSSTALLRSNSSKKTVDYGSATATTTMKTAASSMPDLKRKQIRVKDPYAIAIDGLDDDDMDDDMECLNLVLPKKREEESLADFLRNTPPPPMSPPQPLIQTNCKTVQKKNSSVSLMSRFGRSSRKNSIASNSDKIPPIPQGPQPKYVALKVPSMSEPGLQRTTSANSSGSDQYSRPSYTPIRANFDNKSGPGSPVASRNAPRANAQARGARQNRNDTDSLADFLKHTGPPLEGRVSQPQKEEGRSLLQKMSFSRNKKLGV